MSCQTNQTPIILEPMFQGDTFDDWLIELTEDAGGTELYEPLGDVEMRFTGMDGTVGLTLTSDGGDITIDNAAAWTYTVDAFTMTLAPGIYRWSITMTSTATRIKTWLYGTIEIKAR